MGKIVDEGDGFHESPAPRWANYCPHLNPTGVLLYRVIVSATHGAYGNGHLLIRLDELGKLMVTGGVNHDGTPKTASSATVARYLNVLGDLGQVVDHRGNPVHTSNSYSRDLSLVPILELRHDCPHAVNVIATINRIQQAD